MIVYPGRKGVHIYDIDRERWVYNGQKPGHPYDEIVAFVQLHPDDSSGDDKTPGNGNSKSNPILGSAPGI